MEDNWGKHLFLQTCQDRRPYKLAHTKSPNISQFADPLLRFGLARFSYISLTLCATAQCFPLSLVLFHAISPPPAIPRATLTGPSTQVTEALITRVRDWVSPTSSAIHSTRPSLISTLPRTPVLLRKLWTKNPSLPPRPLRLLRITTMGTHSAHPLNPRCTRMIRPVFTTLRLLPPISESSNPLHRAQFPVIIQ